MNLVVMELKTSLYQQLTPLTDQILYAIRPHIIKYGSPSGTLKVQIQDSNGNLEAEGPTMNISAINAANYWHGYQTFYVNAALKANNDFRVALVAGGGYSFSESAYVGWCNGFDLGKYPGTYSPKSGYQAPMDLELWGYSEQKRGF